MQQSKIQSINHKMKNSEELMQMFFGSFSMLVYRTSIKSFHSNHDIDTSHTDKNAAGFIYSNGRKLPVYCFTDDFELTARIPKDRSICLVLGEMDMAFMCTEIKAFNGAVEKILPLPDCIKYSGTPIEKFCLYGEKNRTMTGMLCTPDSIKKFIDLSLS